MLVRDYLALNPEHPQVIRDLLDCQSLHTTLLYAWPPMSVGTSVRKQAEMLYRVKIQPRPTVIVQSNGSANWERLPVGYIASMRRETIDIDFSRGDRLEFTLRANPIRRVSDRGDSPLAGKRVHLEAEHDLLEWLSRKLSNTGAHVVQAKVERSFKLRGERKGAIVSLRAVDFSGVLEVVDAEALKEAVRVGIGPAKGYGMGLIILNPAERR